MVTVTVDELTSVWQLLAFAMGWQLIVVIGLLPLYGVYQLAWLFSGSRRAGSPV